MKKVFMSFSLVMVFAFSLVAGAVAYQPYEEIASEDVVSDNLIEVDHRAGVTVPKEVCDLSKKTYNGQFTYKVLVYGNYLLKTSNGTIKATVNSKVKQFGGNSLSNIQNLELIKKMTFGTTNVGTKSIAREGKSTVNFTNLEKNKGIYFLALSKANDDTTLTGTISATQ